MNFYISTNESASFNIAMEEYLLKNYTEDFFILYINSPALIVGKHQNTLAEINMPLLQQNKIPVVRRLSGGGTVYHDKGNLNYCFIKKGEKGKLINFESYTKPIISVLQKLSIDAKFEGRSDLTIDGKKFSGNACHIFKEKIMQHGTMLFDSDLSRLNKLLKVNPLKFKDKGIRSIRSRVTNISEHLSEDIDIHQFAKKIEKEIKNTNDNVKDFSLSETDIIEIEKLISEKYGTWLWNYGYSPKYKLKKTLRNRTGEILDIEINIEKGIIVFLEISGSGAKTDTIAKFSDLLINQYHNKISIEETIQKLEIKDYFINFDSDKVLELLF